MNKSNLKWTETERKKVFDCKVFAIAESYCRSPDLKHNNGEAQVFSVLETKDWAITIPVVETKEGKKFVMVWQWRHGSQCLSLEFPGGVFEGGENPEQAAARELHEETGYTPGKIKKLGEFSPNPAIMSNKVYFFLAEDLGNGGKQELDEDEFVEVELVDVNEVIKNMGREPYIHALMGSALSLYYQNNTM